MYGHVRTGFHCIDDKVKSMSLLDREMISSVNQVSLHCISGLDYRLIG